MANDPAQVAPAGNAGANTPTDPRALERREALSDFWITVKRLPAYVRLMVALTRDSRVPHPARAVLIAGGAYTISPIDLVPGIIPIAGQLDDVYVVLMTTRQALRMIPDEVAAEYLERYEVEVATVDRDLAAIRRLVRIGVADGARWSWSRLDRLGRRVVGIVTQRGSETP